jgi:hypothetical protein
LCGIVFVGVVLVNFIGGLAEEESSIKDSGFFCVLIPCLGIGFAELGSSTKVGLGLIAGGVGVCGIFC